MRFFLLLACGLACAAHAQTSANLVALSGYGTLEAGGVVATISGDTDRDANLALLWRAQGEPAFRSGHPLVRIDATRFVGSLFALTPATRYDVRVVLIDPDGVGASATLDAAFSTRADGLPEPTLRTLYVAPGGSDSNGGLSPGDAWLTLQHAADLAQAGDLVLIAPGVYRESVDVPRSGSATQPIVFRGSAAGAVLDGADAAIAQGVAWTPAGNGVYQRTLGFDTGHVVTELGRLFRYTSVAALTALAAGAPGGFHFDGSTLYLKFADGTAPAQHTMHVARHENAIVVDGQSFVRIENLEIRHYGSGDYGKGVYLRYADDCAVRGSRIHEVGAAGVWIKGGSRNRIEDNEIWDSSIFGWPWPSTKGSSAENNAVVLTDEIGQGNVIRRNTFHDLFNGIGPCGSAAPPGAFTAETDVYANTFYRHTDDAIEPEGYCANMRVWGNTIRDSHMAVAVAPAAPGPTWIVRNIAYDFGNTRTSQIDGYTASALKINSGYATPIGPLLLYHNTFVTTAPATEAVSLLDPGFSTVIVARNNVFAGTRYVLEKVNPVVLDWNWDALYTTDATRFVRWQGTPYATLADLRAGTGQEFDGIAAAPSLENPAGGDFRPQLASALIDRGVVLPGINDGYLGTAPDIGAVEREAGLFADGFE
jgi:hypothetical protein